MSLRLAARKIGMTQIFNDEGHAVVCTVLELEPNVVVQVKTKEKDGYSAVQLGAFSVPASKKKNVKKPRLGHFSSKKIEPHTRLFESRLDDTAAFEVGSKVGMEAFEEAKYLDAIAVSKGKGYQGVMKKHGFRGGPAAHGSGFHRLAGSTGMRSDPGRVFPGHKMSGQMGSERKTVEGLHVLRYDTKKNLVLVKGSVPGHNRCVVYLRKSLKKVTNA